MIRISVRCIIINRTLHSTYWLPSPPKLFISKFSLSVVLLFLRYVSVIEVLCWKPTNNLQNIFKRRLKRIWNLVYLTCIFVIFRDRCVADSIVQLFITTSSLKTTRTQRLNLMIHSQWFLVPPQILKLNVVQCYTHSYKKLTRTVIRNTREVSWRIQSPSCHKLSVILLIVVVFMLVSINMYMCD